ncbi:MAG: peptide ABC transporter substrate-binding protein [Leptolyngbyaceae cyanobacterium SM2_3_12]|nr:peptide ABC transporter substrate-binding protein [Leptolyngbyaceae cyanobacterium SM2_3_12]
MPISEADWKIFKQLKEAALERFSERILAECQKICDQTSASAHARYGQVYGLIQERDREMALAFDNPRRSTAWEQLALLRSLDLLTAEEISQFSPDTQRATAIN